MVEKKHGKSNRSLVWAILFCLMMGCFALTGCKQEEKKPVKTTATEAQEETKKVTGILSKVDTENRKLSFYYPDTGDKASYKYDGATYFYSNKEAIAATQLYGGEIVDITYRTRDNILTKVEISKDKEVWHNTKVVNFRVDENQKNFSIGSSLYYYDENLKVFSEGDIISVMELNRSMDQLQVWGRGNQILSIVVNQGHGYLALSGEDLFEGGLITVGNILVRNIEAGMLLAVSEGSYQVTLENGDYVSTKEVTITRNRKTVMDYSDVEVIPRETGNVFFSVDPTSAELRIDGRKYDANQILTLSVGSHKVVVSAEDYESYTDQIEVEVGYQEYTIHLKNENETETTAGTASSETTKASETAVESSATEENSATTGNSSTAEQPTATQEPSATAEQPTATQETSSIKTTEDTGTVNPETKVSETNKVTIKSPEGAAIYFDGTYMGTAPVTFAMITGTHIVTVVEGESVRSYSVTLAEGGDDVVYDFSKKS